MTDWKAKYETLRDSMLAACEGSGCFNAHELRQVLDAQRNAVRVLGQALDAEREAVRVLAAELARVPELVSKVVMKNPIAAQALKEAKA